ncbi:type II toxin-antitoxin system RelE/ParE family toxin [Halobacterium salinarum]|jgi:mRNA-degrading endonuclease RelE of RelBE toxin-antitoxin system|uniref:type II toxin-antitoxin system RelE family toxin n=1 Tax=Halobacterium salinarum TaxID=2242 RepID=UPI0025543EE9|nr:type II toxin-antitoxin system RelE/ParE family toxin [Halobacterium salinarum]MDL0118492.1 type II toxin-antitoxin system RelE/ParE family toxin [Halobacterium salinarum]MDL0118705.1 type II toxin-antitoxin system RelE/ParE family toxin [Halobacterium salinarum]MDL0118783.1 type II toxin-antitoxin system RelE/ParE family toxin [Halobacterium salinarum]MDL0125615.1 type II toxin-antitoxin system RelE/ParE family toxin [Halobacterium salinarum]MDL0137983.1 type II toxin-antitoxin system RelE
MSYNVLLSEDAQDYYQQLDDKSQRIVKDNLAKLEDEPHPKPGSGSGDREKIPVDGEEIYRLHIGRTHTALYDILESKQQVRVIELLTIDEAHNRYGF